MERDHLCAIGSFVEKDSLDLTNFNDIEELILEKNVFNVPSAKRNS